MEGKRGLEGGERAANRVRARPGNGVGARFLETTRSQMDLITNGEAGVLRRKSNRTTY